MRGFALLLCLVPAGLFAQEPAKWPAKAYMELPVEVQQFYLNISGDCVQDSNGMIGAHHGDYSMATLVYRTEYGREQMGGSGPGRVAQYCRDRGIPIYNITGRSFEDTQPWMDWACKTGRFAAVGCFSRHFQTLWGRDFENDKYLVQNNWRGTFGKPYVYTESQFASQHEASGPWVVIRNGAPPALKPVYVKWWE
jgi:hypothetical protein